MTHYYLYIMAGDEIDSESMFFKVAIGTTPQARRDFLYLTQFAEEHGHYFELWTIEVDVFLEKIANSLRHADGDCAATIIPMAGISARDLVRALKDMGVITPSFNVQLNQKRLREFLSLNYRIMSRRKAR